MRKFVPFACFLFCLHTAVGQKKISFTGKVISSDSLKPIVRATVVLKFNTTVLSFAFTNQEGNYSIEKDLPDTGLYVLEAKHLNYEPQETKVYSDKLNEKHSFTFQLAPSAKPLKEVVIKNVWKERESGDTIEYNASQFQTPQTRKVEDLLKNIDGFSVAANGVITYRGKEVKALLINGDDLTQDQYTILSKNLNAGIVEKIQVIDNYSQNRVLGSVIKSNEVAVNLKLKKNLFGKVNGAASVGYAPGRRYDADGNIIALKNKFTLIELAAANNVSKNITGNSFFENETNAGSIALATPLERKQAFAIPVYGGLINLPPLPADYTLHNHAGLSSTLFHIRLNQYVKVSGKVSVFQDSQSNESESSTQTIIDSAINWLTENTEKWAAQYTGVATTLTLGHDNTKNFAGNGKLLFMRLGRRNVYSSLTQKALHDSLHEQLQSKSNLFTAQYSGATKINSQSVLSFSLLYHRLPGQSLLNTATNRYAEHFSQTGSFSTFSQTTPFVFAVAGGEVTLIRKIKNASVKYGFFYQRENMQGSNEISGAEAAHPFKVLAYSPQRTNSRQQGEASLQYGLEISKKTMLKLTGNAGHGRMEISASNQRSLLWNVQAEGTYKMKAFSYISLSLASVKKLPALQLFFPDSLLDGNAAIRYGSIVLQPVQYNEANASFSYYKFRTNTTVLLNTWIKHSLHDYASRISITPSLLQLRYIPVTNNLSKGMLVSGKTLIYPLRSTASFSTFLQRDNENKVVNERLVAEKNWNVNFTLTLVTSFKLPINTEVSYNKFFYKNTQTDGKEAIAVSNHFFTIENKYRVQASKKLYFGGQYHFLKLAKEGYHLSSLFGSFTLSNKSSIDLKVHNLFNRNHFTRNLVTNNSFSYQTFLNVPRYFLVRFHLSF